MPLFDEELEELLELDELPLFLLRDEEDEAAGLLAGELFLLLPDETEPALLGVAELLPERLRVTVLFPLLLLLLDPR